MVDPEISPSIMGKEQQRGLTFFGLIRYQVYRIPNPRLPA